MKFVSLATLALPIAVALTSAAQHVDVEPLPAHQAWRVESLAKDADLESTAQFTVDFERDGTVWIATSEGLVRGDGFSWERLGAFDGLPSDYVRCATVTRDGTVWVGTDHGAARLRDGAITPVRDDAGALDDASIRRIVEEADGTLWFCCDRWPDSSRPGRLVRRGADGAYSVYGVEDGLPTDYVSDFVIDSAGRRFALTSAGLGELRGERFAQPWADAGLPFADAWVWDLVETRAGELLAATSEGLVLERAGVWSVVAPVPYASPKLGVTADGEVLTCVPDQRVWFSRWTGGALVPATDPAPIYARTIEMVRAAPDGSVWAVGMGALLRWERGGGEWEAYADLPHLSHADGEGGLWFAGDDEVLVRTGEAWERIPGAGLPVATDGAGVTWMRVGDGLARWSDGRLEVQAEVAGLLLRPVHVLAMPAGATWVVGPGRDGSGPIVLRGDADGWTQTDTPSGLALGREPVLGADDSVWVLFRDLESGSWRMVRTGAGPHEEVPLPPSARQDAATRVTVGHDGTAYLFGFFGMMERAPGGTWLPVEDLPGRHVFSVVQRDDELWVASTSATGGRSSLAVRRAGTWTPVETDVWWLDSTAPRDEIQYAAGDGLVRIPPGRTAPELLSLPLSARLARATTTRSGETWLQTDSTTLRYRPDGFAPRTRVLHAPDALTVGEDLLPRFEVVERFRSAARSGGQLQFRLDEGPWGAPSVVDDELAIAAPDAGDHVLEVRAVGAGSEVEADPTRLPFVVHGLPLQERSWFLPVVIGALLLLAVLAVLALTGWLRVARYAGRLRSQVHARTADLQASKQRYRALFAQSHEAILVLDETGRVREANREAEVLLGMSADELAGASPGELVASPGVGDSPIERALEQGVEVDGAAETRDGRRIDIVVNARVLHGMEGEPQGHQIVLRDDTQRRAIERRAREAQRIEAVGRLAAGVAHEFNNVLTVITGHAGLLASAVRKDPDASASAELIHEQVQRARAITSQIQGFGPGRERRPSVFRLDEVVSRAATLLTATLHSSLTLDFDLGADDSAVLFDQSELEQVLINLVLNARDASELGGEVVVATRRIVDGGPARVELSVRDRGTGMDAETRRRIFEPFFTTKPAGKGTGLGLSIVADLVRRSDGGLVVESAPGRGTVVRITLPCVEVPELARSSFTDKERRSILVVEDEPAVCELIQQVTERAGYEVWTAPDAKIGLELFAQHEFDLVLSDVMLPGMSGVEFADRLATIRSGTRVILMTGYAPPTEALASTPVLRKPFLPADLLDRVQLVLGGSTAS